MSNIANYTIQPEKMFYENSNVLNILQKRWEEFGKVKGLKFKCLQGDGFPTQLKHLTSSKHAMYKGKYPFWFKYKTRL